MFTVGVKPTRHACLARVAPKLSMSGKRAQSVICHEAAKVEPGVETKGQNFKAVKDIDAIMKALPHRCGEELPTQLRSAMSMLSL